MSALHRARVPCSRQYRADVLKLFNDVESGRPCVVYRRHAYDYGLIRLA